MKAQHCASLFQNLKYYLWCHNALYDCKYAKEMKRKWNRNGKEMERKWNGKECERNGNGTVTKESLYNS